MYAYMRFLKRYRDAVDRYERERTMPDFDFPPRSDCGVALRVQHVQLYRAADFQKRNAGVQNARTQAARWLWSLAQSEIILLPALAYLHIRDTAFASKS